MALSRLVAPLIALALAGAMAPANAVPVVTDTIPVGTNPFGVAVSPDGTRAYVTNYGSASVSVINTTTKAVTATIPVNGSPRGVAVSPNGTRAYSANRFTASVSVINTASDVVSASIGTGDSPLAIAITPNGDRAYVTLPTSSVMSVLDLSNDTVSGSFGVGDARAVAISPVHARAYTTISDMNVVSVINTSNDTVTTNIPVGSAPDGVAVSPDGTRVYVANSLDDTVSVIDTSNNTVTDTIAVGAGPLGVAVSPDSAHVYITNSAADTVSVIDTSNNTVTDTIAVGDAPRGVAVSPDGTRAYVTNFNDNTVSVLELQPTGFSVSPSTVPFGNQLVGAASSAQTLTVTNTGTSNLTISEKELAGADPGQFALGADTCNTPVAPGNTCTIAVSFSPTSPGDKSATLEFTSNALTSPDTVTLSGTGLQPVLNASPDSLDFATVNVGQTAGPQTVTVTNTGTGKLTVSASTVTGAGFRRHVHQHRGPGRRHLHGAGQLHSHRRRCGQRPVEFHFERPGQPPHRFPDGHRHQGGEEEANPQDQTAQTHQNLWAHGHHPGQRPHQRRAVGAHHRARRAGEANGCRRGPLLHRRAWTQRQNLGTHLRLPQPETACHSEGASHHRLHRLHPHRHLHPRHTRLRIRRYILSHSAPPSPRDAHRHPVNTAKIPGEPKRVQPSRARD